MRNSVRTAAGSCTRLPSQAARKCTCVAIAREAPSNCRSIGGSGAIWKRDGTEVFYQGPSGVMAARILNGRCVRPPIELFAHVSEDRNWDVERPTGRGSWSWNRPRRQAGLVVNVVIELVRGAEGEGAAGAVGSWRSRSRRPLRPLVRHEEGQHEAPDHRRAPGTGGSPRRLRAEAGQQTRGRCDPRDRRGGRENRGGDVEPFVRPAALWWPGRGRHRSALVPGRRVRRGRPDRGDRLSPDGDGQAAHRRQRARGRSRASST